ncbi:hypothetical protein L5515_008016 [Caenorhabditis briggsae]|nr:hypothetical protein L5515_008016 [Caenorhabditis briggsae]
MVDRPLRRIGLETQSLSSASPISKKEGTVLKSIHVQSENDLKFKAEEHTDMAPYINYSLNKKRRWEAEDAIGVELLEKVQKWNEGWKVLLLERVNLRSWNFISWSYASDPERYLDRFMIKDVHELTKDDAYSHKGIDSVYGQRFSHFLEENRKPKKENEEQSSEPSELLAAYNFLRAPKNYVALLQKEYKSINYGWDWPHVGYWRRVDQQKDNLLELRYGEVEDLDGNDVNDVSEKDQSDGSSDQKKKSEFYNLEDHFVDKFVVVRRRRRKNTC